MITENNAERLLPRLPCACATLRRAARAVTQLYDEKLRVCGLRATQFTLLQALARTGEMTQGGLGERLALDSTTLSRTLQLLEKQGWIQSKPGLDRRERHLQLTRKGRRRLEQARPYWEQAQAELRQALGETNWSGLFSALDQAALAVR